MGSKSLFAMGGILAFLGVACILTKGIDQAILCLLLSVIVHLWAVAALIYERSGK